LHEQVHLTRRELTASAQDLQGSIDRLSQCDVYDRLHKAFEDEEDCITWLATFDLRAIMRKEVRRRVDPTEQFCKWCQYAGHDETECWVFRQCQLCECYGHITEGCRNPHRFCLPDGVCRVSVGHFAYWKHCDACARAENITSTKVVQGSRAERWINPIRDPAHDALLYSANFDLSSSDED